MKGLRMGRVLLALLFAGAVGAACAKEDPAPVDPSLADVVFQGGATPQALGALLAPSPVPDVSRAPTILDPPNNAVLKVSDKVVFTWSQDGTTAMRAAPPALTPPALPALDRPPTAPVLGPPALLPSFEARSASVVPAWLTELVGPERSASAAIPQMSGRGYFLLFSTDSTPRLLRVFTTKTTYAPDAAAWKTLADAGTWTKLVVVSGQFVENNLLPDAGPFVGAPILFCIEPG